jgi:hypothetical protein
VVFPPQEVLLVKPVVVDVVVTTVPPPPSLGVESCVPYEIHALESEPNHIGSVIVVKLSSSAVDHRFAALNLTTLVV